MFFDELKAYRHRYFNICNAHVAKYSSGWKSTKSIDLNDPLFLKLGHILNYTFSAEQDKGPYSPKLCHVCT